MLYREIIAVCSQIHTKHINTVWAERTVFRMMNLSPHKVTIKVKMLMIWHDSKWPYQVIKS